MAFLNTPNAMLLAGPYAEARKLKKGDSIKLTTPSGLQEFKLLGILAPKGAAKAFGGSVGIMHMDSAQATFGRVGRYDRIDVEIQKGLDVDVVRKRIADATKGGLVVDRPKDRGVRISKMVFALQTGLQLTSGVALLVGIFVVFNTMAIAVLQRRRELATLRALGTPRGKVTLIIAGEAALLGVIGGVLGVLLGSLLARLALSTVTDAIGALYVEVKPDNTEVSPVLALVGFLMGVVTSVVGASKPAWEAASMSPVEVLAGRAHSSKGTAHPALLAVAGVVMYGAAFPVSNLEAINGVPVFGYISAFMVLGGTALLGPLTLLTVRAVVEPLARSMNSIAGQLATGNLVRDLGRASVTSVALMFGLALSIGVGALVGSFKSTMDNWLQNSVPADLFVSTGSAMADEKNIPVKPEIGNGLKDIPGVEDVFRVRMSNLPYEDLTIRVLSLETPQYFKRAKLLVRDGPKSVTGDMLRSVDGVTISENLAHKKNLKAGDMLRLGTPAGPRDFPIIAVAVDFTSDQGFAMMDRETYLKAYGDVLVDMFQINVQEGAKIEEVRQAITGTIGKQYGLNVATSQDFRDYVSGLIDNAFKITGAIQLVAVLIALMGIVNTLLAAVLDRTREIGVLRAVGSLRRQINLIMVIEATLMGLAAAILAAIGGSGFGYIFTGVINFQSTGWSLPFVLPVQTIVESFGIALVVAAVAALIPARRAGKLDIRDALAAE
mgnify:CR=1 FL=1